MAHLSPKKGGDCVVFDTCFFCEEYGHLDPDTDVCCIDGHEVFFDTPKCAQFSPQVTKENPAKRLLNRTPLDISELLGNGDGSNTE